MTYFTLLAPIGLLGLLGVVALIIIYIIKPNYQQKYVSTTFVWKLSLKYRKKRIPTSRLRNILLIVCQILLLSAAALVLTFPSLVTTDATVYQSEAVAIIDASASMLTVDGEDKTRFERAVENAKKLYEEIKSENGTFSVIFADDSPRFVAERVSGEDLEGVGEELDRLIGDDGIACTFGGGRTDKAIEMTENVFAANPTAKVYLYTDKTYSFVPEDVTVVNVGDKEEFNVAVIDATAQREDGYYYFSIDVAAYGAVETARQAEVTVYVQNPNATPDQPYTQPFIWTATVNFDGSTPVNVVFKLSPEFERVGNVVYAPISEGEKVITFESVNVQVTAEDSFSYDNTFIIYGGVKEQLKVQYYSGVLQNEQASGPNPFVFNALSQMRAYMADSFDMVVDEIQEGKDDYAVTGYDFYVFEHVMPDVLPTDGVVLLLDPVEGPVVDAGFKADRDVPLGAEKNLLTVGELATHPLLRYVNADDVTVTKYVKVSDYSDYEVLATIDGNPAIMYVKDGASQIIVLPFSVHYSNIPIQKGHFINFIANVMDYYFPATVSGYSFEVGESVVVNSRGRSITLESYGSEETEFEDVPVTVTLNAPGTYVLRQTTYFDKDVVERIFVRVPSEECNIWAKEDSVFTPYREDVLSDEITDLLLYFAIALVAFMFAEWLLYLKVNAAGGI